MLLSMGRSFVTGTGGGGGGPATDPHFANVVLLLGFEGADGSTTLTDESPAAHGAGTASGNAQIDTAAFAFGSSSGLFDGSGDIWSWANHADWRLSAANSDQFTIEFWVRPQGIVSSNLGVIGHSASGAYSWQVEIASLRPRLVFSTSGSPVGQTFVQNGGATQMSQSVFSHVAIDKDATGKIRIYLNGSLHASATPANSAFFNSSSGLWLGRNNSVDNRYMNGWLDEVRITKGVARYASDAGFTVPTAAYPRS